MRKKLLTVVVLGAFCLAAGAAYAFNCKITSVDGGTLVVKCKAKDAKKLSTGEKVKVKPKIEGC